MVNLLPKTESFMSSYTTQVLIGNSDNINRGFDPEYQLFLSEGNNYHLILKDLKGLNEWIWYPSQESTLDDIFLMIARIVFGETEIEATHKLSLIDHYTEKERFDFYQEVKQYTKSWDKKIMFNLFHSSFIGDYLENLKEYHCDMEITHTRYLREADPETGEINEKGSLFQSYL